MKLHVSAYEDGTECSETSVYKIQTPGNYPEESIQRSEHGESLKSRIFSISITKSSQLMLYREIIAVCSEIHTKHINTPCGQNVEFVNVKLVVYKVITGL